MTEKDYKDIRASKDFLWLYYQKSTEKPLVQKEAFLPMLTFWFGAQYNVDPQQGLAKIVNFLDQKFRYKK